MTSHYNKSILAFLAFNIFTILLIFAFEVNAAYIFDQEDIKYQVFLSGGDFYTGGLSWGDHYLYRLFASIIVTFISASIILNIVEKNAGIVAAISNIPSVIFWMYSLYMHILGTDISDGEMSYGYISVGIIAPILTTWIAYKVGENQIKEGLIVNEVMSIKSYHWMWIALITQPSAIGIIYSLYLSLDAIFSLMSFAYSGSRGNPLSPLSIVPNFLHGLSYLTYVFNVIISSLPLLAYIYLIKNTYLILSGFKLADKSVSMRTMTVFIIVMLLLAVNFFIIILRDMPYLS